jgi:phosphoadenosine phosphosulfate reductase
MNTFSPLPNRNFGNLATQPELTDALLLSLEEKVKSTLEQLVAIAADFSPAVFANSLGAEDMVLTDLILNHGLSIGIFSLDTGRLPQTT